MTDKIRPAHYKPRDGSAVDCSRAQQAGLGKQGYQAYLAGCAAKYLWRFPEKNGREDLQKCIQILNMLLDTMPTIDSTEPAKDSEEKVIPETNFRYKPKELTWQETLTRYLKNRPNHYFTISCMKARLRRSKAIGNMVNYSKHTQGFLEGLVQFGKVAKVVKRNRSTYYAWVAGLDNEEKPIMNNR